MRLNVHPNAYNLFLEAFLGSNGIQLVLGPYNFGIRSTQDKLYLLAQNPEGRVAIYVRNDEEARSIYQAATTAPGWKNLLFLTVPPGIRIQLKEADISFEPVNETDPDPP